MISSHSVESIYRFSEKYIPIGIRFFTNRYRIENHRFVKGFGIMKDMFTEAIIVEQKRIQRLIDLSRSGSTGRGHLKIQKQGSRIYAYERFHNKGKPEHTVYLGPLDSAPVRELVSIKFQEQRLSRLLQDQKLLQRIAKEYQQYDFNTVLSEMPRAYQIAARENSFNQRYEEVRKWANADYPKNPYPFPDAENYAEDGTRLRSKGECIFYNLMKGRGILFRYDCEIEIVDQHGNRKKLCPDFMILCLDGTLIIIEHLGKMGQLRYALDFGERCYWYFQEGYVLSKNFFVTSDDPNHGTDSRIIARVVDQIERMFFGY